MGVAAAAVVAAAAAVGIVVVVVGVSSVASGTARDVTMAAVVCSCIVLGRFGVISSTFILAQAEPIR